MVNLTRFPYEHWGLAASQPLGTHFLCKSFFTSIKSSRIDSDLTHEIRVWDDCTKNCFVTPEIVNVDDEIVIFSQRSRFICELSAILIFSCHFHSGLHNIALAAFSP